MASSMRVMQQYDVERVNNFLRKWNIETPNIGEVGNVHLYEREGIIQGILVTTTRKSGPHQITNIDFLFALTNKIRDKIIDYIKYSLYKTSYQEQLMTSFFVSVDRTIKIITGTEDYLEEYGFKRVNGIMVYREDEIILTVKLYQDAGEYTKSRPKIIKESVAASCEHEARREIFERYSKDWYVLSIDIDEPTEMAEL